MKNDFSVLILGPLVRILEFGVLISACYVMFPFGSEVDSCVSDLFGG